MEFQSIYDEDLSQNKFFQKIQCEHKILIETAPLENWIICVPRSATIKSENLNDTDFLLAHVLVPHDEITEQYTNLLATDIKQIDGKLVSRNIVSSILFEEVYYAKGLIKYKVWCIEVPLLFGSSSHSDGNGPNDYCVDASEPPAGLCIVRGLTDAVALIWNETNSKTVFRKIENICCSFMRNTNCTSQLMLDPSMLSDDTNTQNREKDLQRIKRSVEILFNHCFKKLMYQRRLHEKCVRDAHFRRVFKIALETYIMDILYRWIFDAITLCYVNETETFNTTLRNLSDANLKHFKIDRCNDIIGRVRTELLQISNYTTPIEKLSCLRRAMTAASQCKQNDISVDDLIPILVFVIVKSGLTHWITTLQFLKHFIFTEFSDGSDKGVDSFLITTLEAAIIYIKSIDLNEFRANAAVCDSDAEFIDTQKCVRRFSNKEQFIEYLFAKIRSGDEVEIVKLLKIDKNVEIATGNDTDNDTDIIVINNKSIDDGKHDCDDDDDEGVANDIDIIAEFPLCRLNLQNMHGIGAIHVAAMNGLPKMLNVLLALGVDPEIRDENNFTALHYAAARGHQSSLLLLMHAGADVTAVTNDKNTALHLCCLNGHLSCVKALLYYSAHMKVKIDRNAQNRMGDTAIHMAAKWGFRDIVEVLLEYVVKTDVENRMGETALECAHNSHIAAMLQNAFIVIDTAESGRWEDASYMASTTALNHQEVFRGCFTSSVSIDETAKEAFNNKTQNDKIVAAIRHDDVKLAYHFLGVELPEETMPAICHPLCDCPKCKRISMQLQNRCESRHLMQMYDGNIDECSADGVTILQAAIQKQHIELIAAILKLNAKVSPQAKSTLQTALHLAMLTKSETILDLVLAHADDGDVDIQDVNGDTALHLAVKLNDIHLVECLLKHEPNVRLRNNDGKMPADIARSMLHVNTVRLLDIADNASRSEDEHVV